MPQSKQFTGTSSRPELDAAKTSGPSPHFTPEQPRRGFRIPQAAEYLGASPWFVEVAIRSKKIPAHKLGRHYVVFKDDLDAYVNGLRTDGAV